MSGTFRFLIIEVHVKDGDGPGPDLTPEYNNEFSVLPDQPEVDIAQELFKAYQIIVKEYPSARGDIWPSIIIREKDDPKSIFVTMDLNPAWNRPTVKTWIPEIRVNKEKASQLEIQCSEEEVKKDYDIVFKGQEASEMLGGPSL